MKKFLPFVLVGLVGLIVVIFVALRINLSNSDKNNKKVDDGSSMVEISPEERPIVVLIPRSDSHYIKFKISRFVKNAKSLDYEFLYQTVNDITQGMSGSFDLADKDTFESELLLGTESSGKFRYDEGVEKGSISIRLRDSNGKLMAKYSTDFHMQREASVLTSIDQKFEYTPEETNSRTVYITMDTIGRSSDIKDAIYSKDGYAVFSSDSY